MREALQRTRGRRLGVIAAAVVVVIFGVVVIAVGLDGRSTVHRALQQEHVVGGAHMTPATITARAKDAGLGDLALPDCSVAGKPVHDGTSARCFAEYMRIDALMGTHGATYAQMPRFATKDGKGTDDPARAQQGPNGQPVNNPARNVWVTQTALSTALNTSYIAEQLSLFAIALGAAFLLVGLTIAAIQGSVMRVLAAALTRSHAAETSS